MKDTTIVALDELEWRVLLALKREFEPHEIEQELWLPRAEQAGVPLERFYAVAERLNERGVLGRFSTFLEHVKPVAGGQRVTRYNAALPLGGAGGARESTPDARWAVTTS